MDRRRVRDTQGILRQSAGRSADLHHLGERVRTLSLKLADEAGRLPGDAAERRMAVRLRRARAWLEARCAGAELPESVLLEGLRHEARRSAAPETMARARAIALRLKKALDG